LDIDTARTKNSMDQIIADFQNHQTDILVGTQMVTKGFDFDHIGLVAIINADALLRYVDFRAEERAFQLMVQVGGRAGRRSDRGEVIIQTYSPSLPVFQEVIANNYKSFYHRQMYEREINHFPPFIRLFSIEIKHKDRDKAQKAAEIMALHLKDKLGNRVVGPILPSVPRINNQYILHIVIKTEKDPKIVKFIKEYFLYLKAEVLNIEGIKNARINIDVDPY
jgi:primosomal protein N' (replication factor Y)